jgi:cobalt-zinc-cadmium efflux system membrane fusion protein
VVKIVADYGQMVKPGDVLALIDSVELSQAQMGSRQAAAKFNAAQKAYDRARLLYEGKAISRAELQERQARLEVERADLDYAQNRLRLLGAGGVAPASLPKGSRSAASFALRSPIAGRVVDRKVTPSLVVKEDDELFTVADTSALWCFVQVPEKDLPLVKQFQATITVNSIRGGIPAGWIFWLTVGQATRPSARGWTISEPPQGRPANIAISWQRRPERSRNCSPGCQRREHFFGEMPPALSEASY